MKYHIESKRVVPEHVVVELITADVKKDKGTIYLTVKTNDKAEMITQNDKRLLKKVVENMVTMGD